MVSIASCARVAVLALLLVPAAAAQDQEARTAQLIADLGLREAPAPLSADPSWRKPRRVLVIGAGDERLADLQAVAPGVEIVAVRSPGEGLDAARTADAIVGPCMAPLLDAAGPEKRSDMVNLPETEHGMGHGHANAIVADHRANRRRAGPSRAQRPE